MALKLALTAPGKFAAPNGYRRAAGLHVEFVGRTMTTGAFDYQDQATRAADPNATFAAPSFASAPNAKPRAQQPAGRNPDGSLNLVWQDGAPGYDDVMGKALEDVLPGASGTTKVEDLLKAVAYYHLSLFASNQGAEKV